MPDAANTVFVAVLWSLVVLATFALWLVAMSDIADRVRGNLFSGRQLASMVVVISFVAAVSIGAASAVLLRLPSGVGLTSSDGLTGASDAGCAEARSFVFSFGPQWASFPPGKGTAGGACRRTRT